MYARAPHLLTKSAREILDEPFRCRIHRLETDGTERSHARHIQYVGLAATGKVGQKLVGDKSRSSDIEPDYPLNVFRIAIEETARSTSAGIVYQYTHRKAGVDLLRKGDHVLFNTKVGLDVFGPDSMPATLLRHLAETLSRQGNQHAVYPPLRQFDRIAAAQSVACTCHECVNSTLPFWFIHG